MSVTKNAPCTERCLIRDQRTWGRHGEIPCLASERVSKTRQLPATNAMNKRPSRHEGYDPSERTAVIFADGAPSADTPLKDTSQLKERTVVTSILIAVIWNLFERQREDPLRQRGEAKEEKHHFAWLFITLLDLKLNVFDFEPISFSHLKEGRVRGEAPPNRREEIAPAKRRKQHRTKTKEEKAASPKAAPPQKMRRESSTTENEERGTTTSLYIT